MFEHVFFFREKNAGIVAERGDLVWLERSVAVRAEREIDVRQGAMARHEAGRPGMVFPVSAVIWVDEWIDAPRWIRVGRFWPSNHDRCAERGVRTQERAFDEVNAGHEEDVCERRR